MSHTREIELKFQVPEARREALLRDFSEGPVQPLRLQAHYYDTADGLLARHAVALRLRREGDRWVQTIKAVSANSHGVDRLEHNAELTKAEASAPELDLQRHAGHPAHEQLTKLLAGAGESALKEVYRTEVDRLIRTLHGADGLQVEAALDQGWVVAGEARHALREIEFEWQAGPLHGLFTLAGDWVAAHGLWLDVISKAERGHLLAAGAQHRAPAKAKPPQVDARTDTLAFTRAAASSCLAQILPNASAVASGGASAEHVHQLRVGLRRLRTVVKEMAELNTGLDPNWEALFAAVFQHAGQQRDQQLLETRTMESLIAAGAPPLRRPATAIDDALALQQAVCSTEHQLALLAALAFAMDASPASGPAYEGPVLPALTARLDALHRRLKREARHFDELPAEQQHRLRKQLKKLRYLAEFIAPMFSKTKVARTLHALAPAQDALGQLQDDATAIEACRALTEAQPEAWFAVGWLSAQRAGSVKTAGVALKAAMGEKPFWRSEPRGKR